MAGRLGEKTPLRVAICGGGIAGLTLASFLSKSEDFMLEVFEAKSEVRTVGAGIAIWQCYWDLLSDTHDLATKCLARGIALPNWQKMRGPTLRRSDLLEGAYEFFTLDMSPMIIPRTMLLDILLEEVKTGRCVVHTDKQLFSYSSNDDGTTTLHFSDGTCATTDLLIGADGVHSKVRETMFRDDPFLAQPQFSGQLAYRMKCQAKDLKPDHRALSGFHIWCGDGKCVTSNMVGSEIVQMAVYDNIEVGPDGKFSDSWVKEVSAKEVYHLFGDWEPGLLTLLQLPKEASRWAIHVVKPLPRYISSNVALMGDAAHAMTPHIGMGGGQSIHDAFILSKLLMHPATNRSNLGTALTVYDKTRRPLSQRIAKWSMECGLMYAFLLPEKRDLPPEELGKEFYMRTDWLRERHVLDHELELAETMLEELLATEKQPQA